MTAQTEIAQKNHRRAVLFFWGLLIGATTISLLGNVVHAVLPYIPHVAVQIGAAAVPPIALLAAVHGIALAVRAGASGRTYRWAVAAVAAIGLGAFAVSFLALRGLMQVIGYSTDTAWIFPAIIDTTVAVSTMMLVALGDKPSRRVRPAHSPAGAEALRAQRKADGRAQSAKSQVNPDFSKNRPAPAWHVPAPTERTVADADVASDLIASGRTTQPVETVIAVLAAHRRGESINAAAKASDINYRTAQRIVEAAGGRQKHAFAVTG
jgi:hypothetical protein